uniref:Uncharacterized protein n=1 Tax=Timema monikensis TaxID=170555 RepID=A0A7R9HQV8_9NEOP|nr:unnamed protein product [Timema monikensis]
MEQYASNAEFREPSRDGNSLLRMCSQPRASAELASHYALLVSCSPGSVKVRSEVLSRCSPQAQSTGKCMCGEVEALEMVLEAGAASSTPDIHGGYPVHYAAQMCGPNSEMGNEVRFGLAVLRKLLTHGVDVTVTDQDGRQPILWAASAVSSRLTTIAFIAMAPLNDKCNSYGQFDSLNDQFDHLNDQCDSINDQCDPINDQCDPLSD